MIDELLQQLEQRKTQRQNDYWLAVRKLAQGEKVTPAEIERLLDDVSKTLDELRRDVELIQERRRLREIIDSGVGLEQERTKLREQLATKAAEFEKLQETYRAEIRELESRVAEISNRLSEIAKARQELIARAPQNQKRELDHLRSRLSELHARACELRDMQSSRDATKVQMAQAQLPGLEREIQKLEEAQAKLRESLLEP